MNTYHKIQTVFLRDPDTKFKTLLEGQYALPEFEYLKDNMWSFQEKIDGMNIRAVRHGAAGLFEFKGKTDRADLPKMLLWRLEDRFIPQKAKCDELFYGKDMCFYGEGYGKSIQRGGKYREDQDFVLFDIKIGDTWLQRSDVEEIGRLLGLDVVPITGEGSLDIMVEMVRHGFKSAWGDFIAEGLVARPVVELRSRMGQRVITKLKYKDFERTA